MAPDVIVEYIASLPTGSKVLDPMMGSGTVLRYALEHSIAGVGVDSDPLAVLISRVWNTAIDVGELRAKADHLIQKAMSITGNDSDLSWDDHDMETKNFIDFWFGKPQSDQLKILSSLVSDVEGEIGDALRVALSRLIITKDNGASLARDVSHSRPHRVVDTRDFDVYSRFQVSVARLASRLSDVPPSGASMDIRIGDARNLGFLATGSIDSCITSPPYLICHRLYARSPYGPCLVGLPIIGFTYHSRREYRF